MIKRPSIGVIAAKSAIYRVFVIVYELLVSIVVAYIGFKIISSDVVNFILVNNTVKFLGYMFFELLWFGHIRTRLNLLRRLLRV
ncbi:MAG: hypothetical protein QXE50_05885 [Nitrososphaerota archaeon]